jgi:hypothetical protein
MNVNLHIERLVLDGFALDGRDAALVQAAVRAELTRLFVQNEAGAASLASAAVPNLRAAPMRLSGAETPPRLGSAIAQSVYGAVAR